MKILVTGGAGFIGSHLVMRLLQENYEVVVVDNLNDYYDPALKRKRLEQFKDGVKFYQVDISDKDEFEVLFKENKFDKICHLAAQAGVRYSIENPFVYGDSNYIGTLNVLEFAKRYNVKDVIFASTSSVYGLNKDVPFNEGHRVDTPISIYSASKRACELLAFSYCHLFGLNVTCLRFFTVYGPNGRPDMALFKFTKAIMNDEAIDIYNHGDMERDFTYVTDIVDGFYRALNNTSGFKIFNLGCGSPVKLMDFVCLIEKELGKEAKKNFMEMQPGDVERTYADITKARTELGYEPKVMVEQGVKNFIDWYKKEYAGNH